MKIVNGKKFMRIVVIIIGIIIAICFFNSNNSYSKGEIKTKTVYISRGDTLWSIASYEQENNTYYQGKDVREIIHEIKKLNNINKESNVIIGQKLEVKTF